MIQFTTSKGEFIAVPVPETDAIKKIYPWFNAEIYKVNVGDINTTSNGWTYINFYMTYKLQSHNNEGLKHIWNFDLSVVGESFEIIGLSSDILKDEELAKKVAEEKKEKCNCDCHTSHSMMHFMPCCHNGYVFTSAPFVLIAIFRLHNITGNQLIIKKK